MYSLKCMAKCDKMYNTHFQVSEDRLLELLNAVLWVSVFCVFCFYRLLSVIVVFLVKLT